MHNTKNKVENSNLQILSEKNKFPSMNTKFFTVYDYQIEYWSTWQPSSCAFLRIFESLQSLKLLVNNRSMSRR